MQNDIISIIVPIYNTEKYLEKCLNSIINQTYKNIEILLINDGSTDRCLEISQKFALKDNRISVFSQNNSGQGIARNLGIEKAKGAYIGFVDSDDYIVEDMFECMYENIIKYNAEIAICGMYMDNSLLKQIDKTNNAVSLDNYKLMEAFLKFDSPIRSIIVNKLYKKNIWEEIRFPAMRAREDSYIIYELLGKAEKAVILQDEKYIQHVRNGSTEKQAFNISKLVGLEATKRMKVYIKSNYDDYLYGYACFSMAGMYLGLLEDIVNSYKLFTHRMHINNLYRGYLEEIRELEKYSLLEKERYHYLKSYTKSRFYCIIKIYKEQTILNLKVKILKNEIIKNAVLFLKHR